jgi:diguanylate cyclase (GGDEF)-like protein/PAS domain S-box-containing protein
MTHDPQSDLERLRFVLDASQLALWDWDMLENKILIDYRWAEMLGLTLEEISPVTIEKFTELVHPNDRERVIGLVEVHSRGEVPFYEAVFRLHHKSGNWVWVRGRGLIVSRLADGTPSRMTGVHDDITVERQRAIDLQVKSSQLEAAQRLGRIGSWYWDLASDNVSWTEELFRMQGFDPLEPIPPASRHAELFTKESWEILSQALKEVSQDGISYELELEMDNGKGPMGWMLARGEAVRDEFNEIVGVFGIAQDITARKHTEERLRTMAMQDDLSFLGNRSALNAFLDLALMRAKGKPLKVGCLMMDLDDFKTINDTYGHAVGDEVIQIAANRLARLTRKSDTAFRLSGDEFVIVLDSVKDEKAALNVADRIVKAFREPIKLENKTVYVSASVGVAFSEPEIARSELLKRADLALYQSKRDGKNTYTMYQEAMADFKEKTGR